MNGVTARLINHGGIILIKHLSRNEEFRQFLERFHNKRLPAEAEALIKSEIEYLEKRIKLIGTEDQESLLDLIRSDVDALQENYEKYLSDMIANANVSEDLKELLSEIHAMEDPLFDPTIFTGPNTDFFSEFPSSFWNLENLTDKEVSAKAEQYVNHYFEQLDVANSTLKDGLDQFGSIFEQLRELDDVNGFSESIVSDIISDSASGTVSDNPVIREIIDTVSDEINAKEVREIVDKIFKSDLDPHDIIKALDQEVTRGDPLTPREAFDPQDLGDNCVQALSKVIASQFGYHVPEGVITLKALLNGTLASPDLLYNRYTKCIEMLTKEFCVPDHYHYEPIGTYSLQLTLTLEDLGISVDVDYGATLEDAAAKLAEGKVVMLSVGVEALEQWNGQEGGHVVQLIEVNSDKGTVTVIDTGIRDNFGKPNGNHIEYDLEQFRQAMQGEMIYTTETPPSVPEDVQRAPVEDIDGSEPSGVREDTSGLMNGDEIKAYLEENPPFGKSDNDIDSPEDGNPLEEKTADSEIPTENSDAVSQDTSPDPISEDSSDLSGLNCSTQ